MKELNQYLVNNKYKNRIKMKNILYIGCIILSTISCKAQILPVEEVVNYRNAEEGIPENITYIKDVNHLLDKYIGTWEGADSGKNYEVTINKITVESEYRDLTRDELFMRYKITNTNGTVIINTLPLPDSNTLVLKGEYLDPAGSYVLYYQGEDADCGQNGDVFISVYGTNNTQMQLFLQVYGEVVECTTGYAEQVLPIEPIILTKQ